MVTPAHIVPEWYFLPFYAILRSIPDKLQGVILMLLSIFIIIFFPIVINNSTELNNFSKSPMFRINYRFLTRKFFLIFLFLGWIGGQSVLEPFIFSDVMVCFYIFFIVFLGFTYLFYLIL